MVACVERRFGISKAPQAVEWWSDKLGDEARVVAFVYTEMADETAGGDRDSPSRGHRRVSPSSLPCRENSALAAPSRDIEFAIEGAEGDLAVCTATQGNVGLLDKIEEVIVPGIRDWDKNGVRVYVYMCPERSASACTSLCEG